ncbi:hypothetical protein CEUSTIGMA_g3015.t1 [Chlamydomonas eustigma]|uniref:Uncharacterized protein n=1 Tax=Chlamydomonas eustigma TaxID=1157962 RepID=A0A250WY92_9CHLO|nr:hypothetical protein CEUSTIGMA_g3015.t1 [Chlamydomonas eustigma]|eukprot:GAX75572.1 hypothetical protein CEUSTIGMA_g3015.t1 [Chlamydomonas eustigma]
MSGTQHSDVILISGLTFRAVERGGATGQGDTAQEETLNEDLEIYTEPEDEDEDSKICPPEAFDELYGYRRSTSTAATKQPLRVSKVKAPTKAKIAVTKPPSGRRPGRPPGKKGGFRSNKQSVDTATVPQNLGEAA